MSRKRFLIKLKEKKQAPDKLKEFIELADKSFSSSKQKANNYVRKARRLAMKHKIRWPRGLKRRFCKHCYSYLKPGANCRIRTKQGKVVYYCLECKKYMRFPYTKEKKVRK